MVHYTEPLVQKNLRLLLISAQNWSQALSTIHSLILSTFLYLNQPSDNLRKPNTLMKSRPWLPFGQPFFNFKNLVQRPTHDGENSVENFEQSLASLSYLYEPPSVRCNHWCAYKSEPKKIFRWPDVLSALRNHKQKPWSGNAKNNGISIIFHTPSLQSRKFWCSFTSKVLRKYVSLLPTTDTDPHSYPCPPCLKTIGKRFSGKISFRCFFDLANDRQTDNRISLFPAYTLPSVEGMSCILFDSIGLDDLKWSKTRVWRVSSESGGTLKWHRTTSNVRRCDSLHPRLWRVEVFL